MSTQPKRPRARRGDADITPPPGSEPRATAAPAAPMPPALPAAPLATALAEPPDEHRASLDRISELVHDVSRLRKNVVDRLLRPAGLTCSQWRLLLDIDRTGSITLKQSDFAGAMDAAKATIGGLVHRLEANGLVVRQPDLADKRAKRVVMTPKGAELLRHVDSIGDELSAALSAGLEEAELDCMDQVIVAMRDSLLALAAEQEEDARRARWESDVA